jgi:hypothetical protein
VGEAELAGGFSGRQRMLPESLEHMADESGCVWRWRSCL